jgi:hypothetical protein
MIMRSSLSKIKKMILFLFTLLSLGYLSRAARFNIVGSKDQPQVCC